MDGLPGSTLARKQPLEVAVRISGSGQQEIDAPQHSITSSARNILPTCRAGQPRRCAIDKPAGALQFLGCDACHERHLFHCLDKIRVSAIGVDVIVVHTCGQIDMIAGMTTEWRAADVGVFAVLIAASRVDGAACFDGIGGDHVGPVLSSIKTYRRCLSRVVWLIIFGLAPDACKPHR
jgi:hypothetical protein